MDVSIVVPCFNEEAAIPFFLAAVKPILEKTGMSYEIVFVDDGSRDKTVAVISGLIDSHPEIRLARTRARKLPRLGNPPDLGGPAPAGPRLPTTDPQAAA